MKILAIGRNYAAHAKELNNPVPAEPVIFMKPASSLMRDDKPFYYPDFSKDIHYEVEVVLKISGNIKHIEEKFAAKYYQELSLGIDFTARDLQQKCKEKGLPWEIAKAFDKSAPVGNFIDKSSLADPYQTTFRLEKNGVIVQEGNTANMLFNFDSLISHLSRYFTLNTGDLIFTGTPAGVGPVAIGDKLEAYLEDQLLLTCEVR